MPRVGGEGTGGHFIGLLWALLLDAGCEHHLLEPPSWGLTGVLLAVVSIISSGVSVSRVFKASFFDSEKLVLIFCCIFI